jgi:tRNA threonylcarbamoyladenosine biosynthesis protein TsaE
MKQVIALSDLFSFCKKITTGFQERQLVLLKGPLGAGKTQFVKFCVQALGAEMPDSPTFSLINEYAGAQQPIYHADLYRLNSEADIDSTGFWDLFAEAEGIVFVEWPEKVPTSSWPLAWSQMTVDISFSIKENEREIEIH